MNIVMLTGSPHPKGTTALLAERYAAGAAEGGHRLTRFDTAALEIHPCIGCDRCQTPENRCVFQDDMIRLHGPLIDAEHVVLVTPLYYFGMTAQLKAAIDRFYAVNARLRERPRTMSLLAACGDSDDWAMEALESHYRTVGRYLGWRCLDPLLAFGCYTREDIEQTDYPRQARELGRSSR